MCFFNDMSRKEHSEYSDSSGKDRGRGEYVITHIDLV